MKFHFFKSPSTQLLGNFLLFFTFLKSWQKVEMNISTFTPDITPLILAAHKNNYEILKILLNRGATIPTPHDIKW